MIRPGNKSKKIVDNIPIGVYYMDNNNKEEVSRWSTIIK